MRTLVETVGLLVPFAFSILFLIAGLFAPFGGAYDDAGALLLLALIYFLLLIVVAVHLLWQKPVSRAAGILCSGLAIIVITYVAGEKRLLGSSAYWQQVAAALMPAIACWWRSTDETSVHDE